MIKVRSSTKVKPHAFGGAVRINGVVITNMNGLVQSIHKAISVGQVKRLVIKEISNVQYR